MTAAGDDPVDRDVSVDVSVGDSVDETVVYDLRVTVDRIEGRSVCGMHVGDYFELVASNELRLPDGKHFCVYALASVLPFLAAKQRQLPAGDWLERDAEMCCPDPDERLVMRVERIGRRRLRTDDLT
jgi:uncharacterized repeat protein (TIGR04076 family)